MNDLLEQFLVETRELVQSATEDLLALEGRPGDAEAVNRVFRAFHTLKGSVGLFDYPPWFALLHAAEDGLSAARAGTLAVDAPLIDLSLEALDATARWSDAVEATGRLPNAAAGEVAALAERYRSLLSPDLKSTTEATGAVPDWAARLVASIADTPAGPSTAVRYRPRGDCFFSGDDPLGLVRKVPGLLAVSVEPAMPWLPDGEFDAYACNLDITLLSGAPRPEVEATFRLVSDQVSVVDVPTPSAGSSAPPPSSTLDPVVAAILGEQLLAVGAAGDTETAAGRLEACMRSAANALRSIGHEADAERCLKGAELGADILGQAIEAALAGGTVTGPGSGMEASGADDSPAGVHGGDTARTLRVDATRVDALVGRVGELVVARNALGSLAARAEAGEDPSTLARAIREADAVIGRLATSLHRDAVSLRLMPLSEVFRRFARPVREAARGLGKEVAIDFEGQGTEADKGIVENLFEPLLHVVRNAVDHGLEDAGTRLRSGKPAAGRIRIAAGQDGDGIVVSVADDGRGIDPDFIRKRAVERGLRSQDAVSAMDDAAVTDLIFAPGFSTAGSVGALSGRGVGMDAVRAAAGRMGGRVSVESRTGEGTTVALHLPRTVTLARVLVVGVGTESYGIAMDAVAEVVRVPRSAIHAVAGGAATVLRGRTLPVLRLADLLDHRDGAGIGMEALLLVVRADGETVALEIDRLDDRLDAVVRAPAGLVGTVPGVGGTTTHGDGTVLLVVDPAALLTDPAWVGQDTSGDGR